jgi:mRNA-degrading endonuclease RelE of RelBE toxin-antitoxin system
VNRDVLFAAPAARDYGRLTVAARRQVQDELSEFASTRRGACKILRGVKDGADLCRLRVGEYRIVFDDRGPLVRVSGIFRRTP